MRDKDDSILLSYLAGYLEADGWVTCYATRAGYFMNLGLEGNEKKIVFMLQKIFGGKISIRKARGKISKRSSYRWNCYGKEASEALKKLFPYFNSDYKRKRFRMSYEFWVNPEKREFILKRLRQMSIKQKEDVIIL